MAALSYTPAGCDDRFENTSFSALQYETPTSLFIETNYQGNKLYRAPFVVSQGKAISRGPVTILKRWELKETWTGNPHKLREVTEVIARVM